MAHVRDATRWELPELSGYFQSGGRLLRGDFDASVYPIR